MCVCVCVRACVCVCAVCLSAPRVSMSDVPPKKDAIAILMSNATRVCPPNDPWYTVVIYEAWLEHVDPEEPLWLVPYFGQVVRVGTAEAIFAKRKYEHETAAAREDKELGFHAVLDRFGPDAITWRIVSSETGPRAAMQALANAEEIRLISENGGVLQDMDSKRTQTLNLTKGGKWGHAAKVWAGIDAWRNLALTKFKAAMKAYVEVHDSALVPIKYVDDDGYKLGGQLHSFRLGRMRKGMPNEADIVAWAEALPKWHWDARQSEEYKVDRIAKTKATMATDASKAKRRKLATAQWKNASEEERTAWSKTMSDAQNRPEVRAASVQRGKGQAANETAEQEADRIAKTKTTMATDASKAKRRKISTDQQEKEVRAELESARSLAVPFEKSKKRRAELRAASKHTKLSGRRGDNVLYMVSEDGKTIRRVDKNGMMRNRDIVGPVVDPPPVAEAGPSDLNAAYVSDSESD